MVTNDEIMMSSVLQILKNLVFKSTVLIIPQIMLIFSLQENIRGAPFDGRMTGLQNCGQSPNISILGHMGLRTDVKLT